MQDMGRMDHVLGDVREERSSLGVVLGQKQPVNVRTDKIET